MVMLFYSYQNTAKKAVLRDESSMSSTAFCVYKRFSKNFVKPKSYVAAFKKKDGNLGFLVIKRNTKCKVKRNSIKRSARKQKA
jgi:RNase P protein component